MKTIYYTNSEYPSCIVEEIPTDEFIRSTNIGNETSTGKKGTIYETIVT